MDNKYAKQIRNILSILLTIMLLTVFKVTKSVSINIVLSIFLCIFIMPIANALEKNKVPSVLATIISILVIVFVIFIVCFFIVNIVNSLIKTLPGYAPKILQIDNMLVSKVGEWVDLPEDYSIIAGLNIDWLGTIIMPTLRRVSSQTVDILSDAVVTLLFTVFLMLERHTIETKLIMLSSRSSSPSNIESIIDNISHQVSKYLLVKFIISVFTGICFYFIAVLTNLDFAELWGFAAIVLNFIPNIGSIIITALIIAMSVIQFLPNWTPIIIVSVSTILVQNIFGNIIEPKIQGSQLNLSTFVILVSLSVFGYVWGIVGMFLAVPLLSVLEIIFANMESTKGVAIIMSSGRSLRKRIRSERRKHQPGQTNDFYI